jgi:hypothetical protein
VRRRNIYVRKASADLSIATKLTNAPFLRLLPDSVYDTASLPFYLSTPLFEPDYAAIARRNHSGANRRRWMFTQVLSAMPAFAHPISVCSTPNHSRSGEHAGARARAQRGSIVGLNIQTAVTIARRVQYGLATPDCCCPSQRHQPPRHHVMPSSVYPPTRERARGPRHHGNPRLRMEDTNLHALFPRPMTRAARLSCSC